MKNFFIIAIVTFTFYGTLFLLLESSGVMSNIASFVEEMNVSPTSENF